MPDDPPEVVDAKYERFGSHTIQCMACRARDMQQRGYEQQAVKDAAGKDLLDRDGIHFPVVER